MAARGAVVRSSERIASPSRSRSKARPRPTVPDITSAIQRMPATTGAGGRAPSTTKAKLKISTTTTARKVMVAMTSRLRHSMARSLAAMRSAWDRKPGARGAGGGESGTGLGLVGRAQRGGAEAAGGRLVEDHPPAAEDHHLIRDRCRRLEIVGHQHDHPAGGSLGAELGGEPVGAGRIERRGWLVEEQERRIVGEGAGERQ